MPTTTPAPWARYHTYPALIGHWDNDEEFIPVANLDIEGALYECIMPDGDLIIAAPDLLAACEAYVAFEDGSDFTEYLSSANCIKAKALTDAFRAAIAKATGQEATQ